VTKYILFVVAVLIPVCAFLSCAEAGRCEPAFWGEGQTCSLDALKNVLVCLGKTDPSSQKKVNGPENIERKQVASEEGEIGASRRAEWKDPLWDLASLATSKSMGNKPQDVESSGQGSRQAENRTLRGQLKKSKTVTNVFGPERYMPREIGATSWW
jgi:hypothetical protein